MRVIDSDRFRVQKLNKGWARVLKGTEVVGHVRLGLDSCWYPELPATRTQTAAIQALQLAHEAIRDYVEAVDGQP